MIKDKIRELCKSKNISIPKLESELGISSGTISRWDKSAPTATNLVKVARYFNVTVDELLGNELKEKPHIEQDILDLAVKIKDLPPDSQKLVINQVQLLIDLNKKH